MLRIHVVCLVVLVATVTTSVFAQDGPSEEDRQRFEALGREVMAHFAAGRYEEAAKACRAQSEIVPEHPGPLYNLACALARLGKTEGALASLARAIELGWADPDHMTADPDLESLREKEGFTDLVAKARKAKAESEAKLYTPGEEIEGVTTREGHPEGGLRYRLRLPPDASAEKPARLVVWLHPAGGSMNREVERLAPRLATKGYGLLVPTAKVWTGWAESEAKRLLEVTLPEVGKAEDVDVTRPILLGFSAGGQMAIELWAQGPGRFGGLVIDAAYPIDMAAYSEGRVAARRPPTDEAVKKVPFFVLVGDQDQGSRIWQMLDADWRKADVPLVVHLIPGGRHEWLFREAQIALLLEWLDEVKAGKLPGASSTEPADEGR